MPTERQERRAQARRKKKQKIKKQRQRRQQKILGMTRREFLIRGGTAAAAAAAAIGGGVALSKKENPESLRTRSADNTPRLNKEYNEEDIRQIARQAAENFNRVLGVNINVEQAAQSVHLVETLEEYQEVIAANTTNYIPEDEITRVAFTTEDSEIYVYKQAVDHFTRTIPESDLGARGRADAVEFILTHEVVHQAAPNYSSPTLHDIVWNGLVAEMPGVQELDIQHAYIKGAEVKGYSNGELKSVFQDVDEAETEIIARFIYQNRGRQDLFPTPPSPVPTQVSLMNNFLSSLGEREEMVIALGRSRVNEGGREEWCLFATDRLGIRGTETERLTSCMDTFLSMELAT